MNAESIIWEALQRPTPEERQSFLLEACGTDAALLQELQAMLAAHEKNRDFLNTPAIEEMATVPPRPGQLFLDGDVVGSSIGPYKLLQKLGEGGMGIVWVAEQEQPVKRRVALKLVKAGMDTAQVVRRFEAERQALAMMDHTNIAKVLDVGTTSNGRPFFVMELVKGVPITRYCDEVHASIEARLDLFVQVCSAVQHAHQKGIIHRDIKPSNILIAMQDGKPVPKVIDFGVAKALHSRLSDKTMYTEIGQVIGTLEYMAPEQAELSAMDIDTRADIYALGVVLYELLTGSTPITQERMKSAAIFEVLRIIKEEEPQKPSTRLTESKESLASLAALRKTDPKRLSSVLKGELDWVVLKALEKDRTCRYETANGLARDIQRYLSDEVVEARPPSVGYRLRKFVRRNQGTVLAAGLLLFALLAGIAGTTFGLFRAERSAEEERLAKVDAQQQREKAVQSAAREAEERKKADAAKVEAQAKEAEANAVVKFVEEHVFAAARPKGEGGVKHDVSLREAIVASLPALDKSFTAQPLVEARLRMALGITFTYLAEHEKARSQLEQARNLRARHLGPEHPETLKSMGNLAISYMELNRGTEALKLMEEVLAIQKRSISEDHPDALKTMHNLANIYEDLNRPAKALKLREEVLEMSKRVLPKEHPDTLKSMHTLALSYVYLNRPAEALKLLEEVLEIRRRVLPKDHIDTVASMNNLASSYADANRHADALKLYEEALEIWKRVLPQGHPDTFGCMVNMADSYQAVGRVRDAVIILEEALPVMKSKIPNHPFTLTCMGNLANIYAVTNRPAEALKLHEELLEIQKRLLPKDHPNTLKSMVNLAYALMKADRGAEAVALIDDFLPKANRPAIDPRLLPMAIDLRLKHFYQVGNAAECRATAEKWEKLNRADAGSLYAAACHRAVTAVVQAKSPGADAPQLAQADADKAMEWLHQAVKAGFQDAARMKKDPDLNALREREDFKKLLADLEKGVPKK